MLWRPFDPPLSEWTTQELERLLDEGMEESLFLEYKSEWSAAQIAKSVAGFANTREGP